MGQNVIVTGMVLLSAPVGDFDKRVVILTKERGKITAFAKGARRPNSQLLAAVNPFSFGEFELFEGRTTYTVSKANISNYFQNITKDLSDTYYGMYFLEAADYFAQENNDEKLLLLLLYQSLRALEKEVIPNRLVRCIYELKLLVINGEYPNVFSCQNCGSTEELGWFSLERSGVLCEKCRLEKAVRLDESTLYTLQYIISAKLEKLYTFTVKEDVLVKVEKIVGTCFREKVERSFKTLPFLEDL